MNDLSQGQTGASANAPQAGTSGAQADGDLDWSRSLVASWLATGTSADIEDGEGATEVLHGLCQRLREVGIPVDRANMLLDDHHPQIAARGFRWDHSGGVNALAVPLGTTDMREYAESPIKAIREEGVSGIRQRLDGALPADTFGILQSLKAEGYTDYTAMPLTFSDGSVQFISWATKSPEGFSTAALKSLYDLLPLICMRLEIDHRRLVTKTLLNTYHGRRASRRILGGTIRRNQGERIAAILVYSDLRGFTRLADRHEPEAVTRALGEYYEAVAAPIEARGGDIIKMVGDGLLSIFTYQDPMMGPCENTQACEAVGAVMEAHENLLALKPADLPGDINELRAGFALHSGTVTFGNVGSSSRLDFTAIGPAVNEVTRVEALTKTLGSPILATSKFAQLECDVALESVGFHALRGVREPQEIFTLKEFV